MYIGRCGRSVKPIIINSKDKYYIKVVIKDKVIDLIKYKK